MTKLQKFFIILALTLAIFFVVTAVDDDPNNNLFDFRHLFSSDEIRLQILSPIDYSVITELRDSEIYTSTTSLDVISLYGHSPFELVLPDDAHSISYYVTSITDDGTTKTHSSEGLIYRHQIESETFLFGLSNNAVNYLTVYAYNNEDILIKQATFVLINHFKHFKH